jgi:hypothetical protein
MTKVHLRPLLWLVVATAFLFECQGPEPAPLQSESTRNPDAAARAMAGAAELTTTGIYEAEKPF